MFQRITADRAEMARGSKEAKEVPGSFISLKEDKPAVLPFHDGHLQLSRHAHWRQVTYGG
jgi:hypothetical protein